MSRSTFIAVWRTGRVLSAFFAASPLKALAGVAGGVVSSEDAVGSRYHRVEATALELDRSRRFFETAL